MWNLFRTKTPTKYPEQQLSQPQLGLLNDLDQYLVEHRTSLGPNLSIKSFKVSLSDQRHSVKHLIDEIQVDGYYIPRTVALIVDANGTWCFYYGLRNNDTANEITNELFIDTLIRTNNARTIGETNE